MIEPLVTAFVLTLARVGTFVQVLPLVGGANVPRSVKVGFSLALAVLFFTSGSTPWAVPGLTSWPAFALALGREMVLGAVLGFAMSLFLVPARVAAEFITQEAGLSFANMLTASGDGSSNTLTVLFDLLASLIFFTLDLHHVFLLLLRETFDLMPIGQAFHLPRWDLVAAVSAGAEGGLLLAAPVAVCLFLTTVVLVLMARAAPQLNLYSIGFALRVLVSLGAMLLMMPQIVAGIIGLFSYFLELLQLRA